MTVHVIEHGTEAFHYLAEAFANTEGRKVSVDFRIDGGGEAVAVKIGEDMWTASLRSAKPHVSIWADGFGVWHARVIGTDNEKWAHRIAFVTLANELDARAPSGGPAHFTIGLTEREDVGGGVTAYTFREESS
jgi:hypothetical protein